MEVTQIWQKEGCGTDSRTLRKVIEEFRENGVQGIKSSSCLTAYIEKLSDSTLLEMYRIDSDVTLQIMVDCLGVREAFEKAVFMAIATGSTFIAQTMAQQGWISQYNYAEACKKYDERVAKAQAEADEAQERMFEALRCKQAAEQEAEALKFEIVTLKAKLYDTYEAIHNPTDKNEVKGDHNKCKARTEKTPSGSWA